MDTACRHRPRLCIASRGKNYDDMLCRFHLVPERNGWTDRQTNGRTDIFAVSMSRVSMLTRDKKSYTFNVFSFCRAIPCKRGICRQCGVCPSVTFVDSVETNKHILKIFHVEQLHHPSFFLYQTLWQYSDGTP